MLFDRMTATCPMRAHWRHLANTIESVHPSVHSSPQPKRQIDRLSRFCTAHGRISAYNLQWAPLSTRIAPSNGGSGPPCNTSCLGPMRAHNPNGTSIGSAVFAQMTEECPYTLQWFASFPLKIAPSHVGIWTSYNTWCIGLTRVRNPNGNLIISALFAGLTSVTD